MMKGLAMLKIGSVGMIDKQKPECGPADAIVRPIAVAPCTSDIHTVWEGAIGERSDMILGHEGVGIVEEVGPLVKDFKPGDRVVLSAITPDWSSLEAQDGFPMHSGGMLSGWKFSNFKDGVFAEFTHVNDADGNLAILPDEIDVATGCMLSDMMPTGFHGAENAEIEYGDTVLIIGIGPVGLMAVAGAALKGAGRIMAVGTRPNCIEVAKTYGATDIISYKDGDIADQAVELNGGKPVDRVIIAGGNVNTFATALRALKPGGILSNVNYLGEGEFIKVPLPEWGQGMGHKTIRGGLMLGGRRITEKLINMILAGRVDPGLMVTHRFEGINALEESLLMMKDKPKDLIKPVVILDKE